MSLRSRQISILRRPKTRPVYGDFDIEPHTAHLELLRDISNISDERLFIFLKTQLRHFGVVFCLFGNHEPYGTSFPAAKASMRSFQHAMHASRKNDSCLGEFVFLDQTRYDLTSHCAVLGCTLFSRIRPEQIVPVQLFWSDFSNIENWKLEDHNEAHASDVSWVNRQGASIMRQEPSRTIVIFTHHSQQWSRRHFIRNTKLMLCRYSLDLRRTSQLLHAHSQKSGASSEEEEKTCMYP